MTPTPIEPCGPDRADLPRGRALAGELSLALLGSVLLACVVSWPLLRDAWRCFPSCPTMPDLNVAIWFGDHVARWAQGAEPLFFAPGLHHPMGQEVGNLVWNVGIQILQLPFFLLFEPVPAYNLSMVALAGLNGLGGWVLGRSLGGQRAGAALAAVVLVCSPYAWAELIQGRGEQGLLLWLALCVAGLLRLGRTPSRTVAVLTGLAWAAAGICYWFYAYFLLLIAGCLGLWWLARRRWEALAALALASTLAAALAAPFAGPMLLSALGGGSVYRQSLSDPLVVSAGSAAWTSMKVSALLWPLWTPLQLRDCLPMGTSLVLLAGALRWRRTGWLPALGLAALVMAFGGQLHWVDTGLQEPGARGWSLPFAAAQAVLPGFWRLLWPYRFTALVVVAAGGCAAALVAAMGRWRWVAVALLGGLAVGELVVSRRACGERSLWTAPDPIEVPSLFRELAGAPGSTPLLKLPLRGATSGLLWIPYHRQPVTEGLGDGASFLQTEAWLASIETHPGLRALQQVGDERQRDAHPDPSLAVGLADLGMGWAVLVLTEGGDGLQRHRAFLGEPQYQDDVIAAWRLEMAGGSAP